MKINKKATELEDVSNMMNIKNIRRNEPMRSGLSNDLQEFMDLFLQIIGNRSGDTNGGK